jgi:ubiquinone/menaquinone biosynthesis C-methylase UbiE
MAILDEFYTTYAEQYDQVTVGVPGDIDYYVARYLEAEGPVVEVGVGTGRIAIPALQAGVEVIGVDLSPKMLAICRTKAEAAGVADRLTTIEAPMQSFELPAPVDLIAIPFRTFLHNLTTEDQRATLAACYRALKPGGRLVLNIFNPSITMIANWLGRPDDWHARASDPTVEEQHRYEPSAQVVRSTVSFKNAEGRRDKFEFHIRWIYRFEMEHLLELAGFDSIEVAGDFDGSPFDELATEMVWSARRPYSGRGESRDARRRSTD